MKRRLTTKQAILTLIAIIAIAVSQHLERDTARDPSSAQVPADGQQKTDPANWSPGQWVTLAASVKRTLADDNDGSRHQRFIISVPGGRTLLVAHNIDLAERIPLKVGDRLSLHGRYETNNRGGVIHWTHHDPDGSSPGGWIEFDGKRYR